MQHIVEKLAAYAVREQTARLPDAAWHHARRAVVDWFAALIAGSASPPATLLLAALADEIGHGRATLYCGHGLKAPMIDFRSDSGRLTHVTSANGVYDQNTRKLTLMGNVRLTSNDLDMKTDEAVVDMINSNISGDKHVEGTNASGHIVAESFVITDNGAHSLFRGRGDTKVWITINNTK